MRPAPKRAATAAILVLGLLVVLPIYAAAEPGAPPVPDHSAAQARDAADTVLSRPEYKVPSPTVLQRIRTSVGEQLSRFLGKLGVGGSASILAWLILAVAVAIVAFLVIRFAKGVTPDAARRAGPAMARPRTADDWRAEAVDHEEQGQWRAGLRCRYRALVADLAQRGLVDEVPGRTTGEYRAEVDENVPKVAPEFGSATELFEAAWYGNRPTGEEESARFRQLADRVLVRAKS